MDKPTQQKRQIKALDRTLVGVKRDIATFSQELKHLDDSIKQRKQEIKALDSTLNDKRIKLTSFDESASDILNKGVSGIKGVISQRKLLESSLKQLQKAKIAVELEILEKKKTPVRVPELKFANQMIGYVKKSLDTLTKKNDDEEKRKKRIALEIYSVEDADRRVKAQKKATEAKLKLTEAKLSKAEKDYEARAKSVVREQAKLNVIKRREREVEALRRRLTAEYKKAYEAKPRRAIIG